jgi:hypothetical protein
MFCEYKIALVGKLRNKPDFLGQMNVKYSKSKTDAKHKPLGPHASCYFTFTKSLPIWLTPLFVSIAHDSSERT